MTDRGDDAVGGYEGPRDDDAYTRAQQSGGTAHQTPDLYRALVQTVRDYAIFALDRTGHVLTWNAGAERLKQYTPEEIIGRHFSVFYPKAVAASGKPERVLREAAEFGSVIDEGWRVRRDGTQFWANVVVTAIRDADGELIGFAKVTRDLTERRRAEQALRESEERFRLLVQGVKDYAIFMLDPEGRVATWNEGAQRIKGYTAEEIIGRHFSTFYQEEAVASQFPQYELEVATREGRFEDEGWRVRKDGSLFWANVVITALRDSTGELVGFAKVTRDLTERQKAQQRALADARRVAETEAANRTKTEFLTAVSHELRTPLNAIGGYTDLLSMEIPGTLNETQQQYVQRVRSAQQLLLSLVNDLLNYTRVEGGRLEYDIGPVQIAPMLTEIGAMVEPQARTRNIVLEIGETDDQAVAWADAARVQQILLNLLSNAVKFTPAGGTVTMACSTTPEHVRISVTDTGPGIPEESQQSIFEPFVQLGRTLTTSHEGVGLGLAISRDLARAINGDLTVASEGDHGSTFTLTLPTIPPLAGEGETEQPQI